MQTIFWKTVTIFSKFFSHIFTKEIYNFLALEDGQKSLIVFLIFPHFGRQSHRMAGSASENKCKLFRLAVIAVTQQLVDNDENFENGMYMYT